MLCNRVAAKWASPTRKSTCELLYKPQLLKLSLNKLKLTTTTAEKLLGKKDEKWNEKWNKRKMKSVKTPMIDKEQVWKSILIIAVEF
jgi:hypothetical protein